MTIEDIENKLKNKIATYENELDEEFKELLLNYIKIFHLVHEHQVLHIQELQEKDNSNKEIAVKLTELKLNSTVEYPSREKILKDYKFFLDSIQEKGLNIDEIQFKTINE